MKVLLIHPLPPAPHWPRGIFRSRWVPGGVAFLGRAMLRAGHEVRVYVGEEHHMKAGGDREAAEAALWDMMRDWQPGLVGISATTAVVDSARRIAARARQLCGPGVLIAVGGPHPTALPERTLRECADFDVAAVGEGEATLVELAERGPAPSVAGIAYLEDGELVSTPPRPPEHDLDALGPPAYELFDMDFYTARDRWLIRWLPYRATNVRTGRGCTNRCRFCGGHLVSGVGVRTHSVEYVIEQLTRAADQWGVEAIRFEDDTLGADPERLMELCEAIRRADLHRRLVWDGCLRVDQAEPELLRAMKSAGCIQVEYGFESGSTDSLRRLGKNASIDLNRRAVELTRDAGLRIFADIMVGLPGETEEDFDATVRFLRWAKPEVISAGRLVPLPGTPIYNSLPENVRQGFEWGRFSYYDEKGVTVNFTAMPDEVFERKYRRFMKYFYRPVLAKELLRDSRPDEEALRGSLRRRLRSFLLHHPVRYLRLPI